MKSTHYTYYPDLVSPQLAESEYTRGRGEFIPALQLRMECYHCFAVGGRGIDADVVRGRGNRFEKLRGRIGQYSPQWSRLRSCPSELLVRSHA